MDLGIYELYGPNPEPEDAWENYANIFLQKNSSETILNRYFLVTKTDGSDPGQHNGPNGYHTWGGNTPIQNLIDDYRMADGSEFDWSNPAHAAAPYENRDPRFYASVIYPGAELDGQLFNPYPGSDTPDEFDRSNFNNTETGFVMRKYLDVEDRSERTNSGINIIKMRYADVLLMYAEAKIELGEWSDPSVEAALNEIRDRVDMPDVELTSQEQAIELVRNERAVELGTEGLRLPDIRRWSIAEEVMPGQPAGMDIWEDGEIVTVFGTWQRSFSAPRDYLWPIPVGERDLNDNLAQNPGY